MYMLCPKSRGLCPMHLRDRLIVAEELGDKESMKEVKL